MRIFLSLMANIKWKGDRMKKKNGFTVVELVVSFSLVMVIVLFLFQIIISLREMYVNNGAKSSLLNKQALMMQQIYDDFRYHAITSFTNCGDDCVTFTFQNNTTTTLKIDRDQKLFEYGDYVTKLVDGSQFGDFIVSTETIPDVSSSKYDSILKIVISITNPLVEGDYGVTVVYQYNSNATTIS